MAEKFYNTVNRRADTVPPQSDDNFIVSADRDRRQFMSRNNIQEGNYSQCVARMCSVGDESAVLYSGVAENGTSVCYVAVGDNWFRHEDVTVYRLTDEQTQNLLTPDTKVDDEFVSDVLDNRLNGLGAAMYKMVSVQPGSRRGSEYMDRVADYTNNSIRIYDLESKPVCIVGSEDDVSAVKQCFPLTVSEVRMAGVSDSKLNNTLTDMIVSNKMLPFSQSDGIKAIRDIQKAYMADVIHDTQYFNDGLEVVKGVSEKARSERFSTGWCEEPFGAFRPVSSFVHHIGGADGITVYHAFNAEENLSEAYVRDNKNGNLFSVDHLMYHKLTDGGRDKDLMAMWERDGGQNAMGVHVVQNTVLCNKRIKAIADEYDQRQNCNVYSNCNVRNFQLGSDEATLYTGENKNGETVCYVGLQVSATSYRIPNHLADDLFKPDTDISNNGNYVKSMALFRSRCFNVGKRMAMLPDSANARKYGSMQPDFVISDDAYDNFNLYSSDKGIVCTVTKKSDVESMPDNKCFQLTSSEIKMAQVSDKRLADYVGHILDSGLLKPVSLEGHVAMMNIQDTYEKEMLDCLSDGFVKNNSTKGKSLDGIDGPALDDLLSKRAVMPPQYRSQMTF